MNEAVDPKIPEQFQKVAANIRKTAQPISEFVDLMTNMRDTWQEAFDQVAKDGGSVQPEPRTNHHGASLLNVRG